MNPVEKSSGFYFRIIIRMKMRQCKVCGCLKHLDDFYKSNMASCKNCVKLRANNNRAENLEQRREYDRNRPNAKERTQKYKEYLNTLPHDANIIRLESRRVCTKAWDSANKAKRSAQGKLGFAVKTGEVVKPSECSQCGCSDKQIQGHHWSYLEENWLNVIWLCTSCHAQEHRRLREVERNKQNKAA